MGVPGCALLALGLDAGLLLPGYVPGSPSEAVLRRALFLARGDWCATPRRRFGRAAVSLAPF